MKLLASLTIGLVFLSGCKLFARSENIVQITNGTNADHRVSAMGVLRIRTTYSLSSGNFRSTCTGTLLHSGDQTFRECVALSAAHCFKNIPRGAEHSLELLDPSGNVQKVFRANGVYTHPDFQSTDAKLTAEESAVDAALLKFNCSLPASVKSARILDYNQVPIGSQLTIAGYGITKSEIEMANENEAKGLGRVITEDAPMASQLMQTNMRLRSIDFPRPIGSESNTSAPGVFSLAGVNGQSACQGDSGGPAFFDNGRELLLVATLSGGAAHCEKATARYTIASSLIPWMEEVVGGSVVSYVGRLTPYTEPGPNRTVSNASASTTPTVQPVKIPEGVSTRLPTTLPNSVPEVVKTVAPVKTPQPVKTKIPTPSPTPRPVVPAPPPAEEEFEGVKVCSGKKWAANAKTRVWGTVIKLLDKDSTQIFDDTLKCDFPNESELCLVSHPVATGTGNAKAELFEDIELPGCEKFTSGKTIYIFLPDFVPR